jgi:eukaryotic-like serine/threonine-protein kinase
VATADLRTRLAAALDARYALGEQIGEGGMATVFLARDLRHDRQVALKVLKPDLGAVLGGERFLAEIRVTANLQHPNLLSLFDSGQADGLLYYVMPFVRGESLRARLEREKQLPVDEALRIAKTIAGALEHAHRAGVIHRDLKPENVLLQDGQPLLADFGIALAVSNAGGQRVTQTGLSLGTPQYMSPEQATGDRAIDARSDLYSLGAIVYEMLAGEPPHAGSTAQAVIAKLVTEEPRPLRQLRKAVPETVERAVRCALEKLPADRFASAREFADALEGRHSSLPVYAAATPERGRATRWTRTLLPLGAAGLLGAAAGGWMLRDGGAPVPGVTVRYPLLPPLPGQFITGKFAVSPDGGLVVFAAQDTATGVSRLFLRRAEVTEARPLEGTDGALGPAFSPDGAHVVFVRGREVRKLRLADGNVSTMARVNVMGVGGPGAPTLSWAVPEQLVMSVGGRLYTIAADGGTPVQLPIPDSLRQLSHILPIALPDGRTVVFTNWRGAGFSAQLAKVDLETRRFSDLGIVGVVAVGYMDGHLLYLSEAGSLMAVPMALRAGTATGKPVTVLTDLLPSETILDGQSVAAMGNDGTLAYRTGTVFTNMVLAGGARDSTLVSTEVYLRTPRFSPDGRRLAVTLRSPDGVDIWLYNMASGTLQRLSTNGSSDRPEWTPDGTRVLYRSGRDGRYRLWSQPVSGGEPRMELEVPDRVIWEGVYSPDGRWLVYRTGTLSTSDIWTVPVGRPGPHQPLATTPYQEVAARVSPDGQWVAYTSQESGREEVYLARFPSMADRLQVSDGGADPVWADARTLYYYSGTGDGLTRAELELAPVPRVVSRQEALRRLMVTSNGHAAFDLAPDRTRFLVVNKTFTRTSTVVAHGWQHELRRMLAAAKP